MSPTDTSRQAIRRAMEEGRHDDAESICRQLAADMPGRADGMLQLGLVLRHRGAADRELTVYAAARAIEPGSARVHIAFAAALVSLGRNSEAADAVELAVALGIDAWPDLFNAGSILLHAGRRKQAIDPLRAAARLQPQSVNALKLLGDALAREQRFVEAADVFARIIHISPEDWAAHLNLAVALRKTGREPQSIGPLARVVQLKPARADLQHTVAMALGNLGRFAEAAPFYMAAARKLPEVLRRKGAFYTLQAMFDSTWDTYGRDAACDMAIDLLDQADRSVWDESFGPTRAETWTFLAEIAARSPRTPLDTGIEYLLDRKPVDALRCYAAFLRTKAPISDKYNAILESGQDLAHPAWHLMNPFFYIWAEGATHAGSTAQDAWRVPRVFNAKRSKPALLTDYGEWLKTSPPSREELKRCFADLAPPARRAIDIGCGVGHMLLLMATDCGLPVEGVFGCDLHAERVEGARHLLAMAAEERGYAAADAEGLAVNNVFQCDALAWDVDSFVARHGTFDVVTLFVITGCFDDGQLDNFLSRIARLGARRIFETSVVDRWDLWVGRKDGSEHFMRHGYRCVHRRLPGQILTGDARQLVLPRKYWAGHQISIYDRI